MSDNTYRAIDFRRRSSHIVCGCTLDSVLAFATLKTRWHHAACSSAMKPSVAGTDKFGHCTRLGLGKHLIGPMTNRTSMKCSLKIKRREALSLESRGSERRCHRHSGAIEARSLPRCGSFDAYSKPAGIGRTSSSLPDSAAMRLRKRVIMPDVAHRQHRYRNNRAENQPTRERKKRMRRFKSAEHAQRFVEVHGIIASHFRPRWHLRAAADYRRLSNETLSQLE